MHTRIAAVAVLASFAGGAYAADWNVDPKIVLQYEYDDNNRMTIVPEQEISVSGALLDAQVAVSAATPRTTFSLTPRVRASKYPDEEDDEITDASLGIEWDYRGQRSIAALGLDYSQRTILGRYFAGDPGPDDGGLGEPGPGTGSGRTADPTDRNEFRARPSFGVILTERTSMLFRAGYLDTEFDDQVVNDRVNFTNTDAAVGLRFRTTPQADVTVFAGASRYEPEDRPESDSQYASVEWSKAVSEVSKVYVRGGANRVKSDDVLASDWETGFSGGAGVQWSFEVTELLLDYNRYVDPSASGQVVDRDQLRFQLLRRFSDRTNLKLSARAIRDGKVRSEETLETREFFAGGVEYEWRFTRPASLIAGYQYTWREFEDDPTDADSNRFYLGVRYQPRRR